MAVSLLPPSAPFTSEQRAWLDGFFAGLLGLAETPDQPTTEAALHTAANALPALAGKAPDTVSTSKAEESPPWHDPALSLEERMQLASDRPIADQLMSAMAQLDCGACGYVCRTYSLAIGRGEEKNLSLCSPGGAPTVKAIKRLLKEHQTSNDGIEASPPAKVPTAPSMLANCYCRKNPFPAKLVESSKLNGVGSQKETRHVRLNLAGSGLTYRVGDALGVFPTNCDALISQIVNLLGATGQEVVIGPSGTEAAFFHSLRSVDLKNAPEELIELLFKLAAAPEDRRRLRTLGENDGLLATMDVLDALQIAPSARPSPEALLATLTPLAPRLYSIASSPAAHGDEIHLTVGKVFWEKAGRLRKGVASTMLADRVAPGDEIPVFIQASHGFTLPESPAAPIIMVGPGTGIAPFRGFLHERQATAAPGRNWLFFGDQRQDCDFLYRDELEQFRTSGVLQRLDTAFSRDNTEKVYVQHRMVEHGAELFRWLEEGAYFYVCGDASRMAKDVDAALHEVVRRHGNHSADDAKHYVAMLVKQRRYRRDVY